MFQIPFLHGKQPCVLSTPPGAVQRVKKAFCRFSSANADGSILQDVLRIFLQGHSFLLYHSLRFLTSKRCAVQRSHRYSDGCKKQDPSACYVQGQYPANFCPENGLTTSIRFKTGLELRFSYKQPE